MALATEVLDRLRAFGAGETLSESRENEAVRRRQAATRELLGGIQQAAAQPGFDATTNPMVQQLIAQNPVVGQQVAGGFLDLDQARQQALFKDAIRVRALLKNGQIGPAIANLDSRIAATSGDPDANMSDTQGIRDLVTAGNVQEAIDELDILVDTGVQAGILKAPAANKTFQPRQVVDAEGNLSLVIPTVDFQGNVTSETVPLPPGTELAEETPQQKRAGTVEEKALSERRKLAEKRAGKLIERGVLAAESTANIRRGIELLNRVETGGFDAAAQRAKSIFGIESADEGELSSALGEAVLSDLRETFGAAFTEKEGQRLERIRARLGASPETNRRLLGQALRIAERTARRAAKAARERDQESEALDIEELLDFTLTDDMPASAQSRGKNFVFNPRTGQLEAQ